MHNVSQVLNGKAFEYACLNALYQLLHNGQPVNIEASPAFNTAREAYENSTQDLRNRLDLAANAAARVLVDLEPQLENPAGNTPLYLSIQPDSAGRAGDVRDILAIRRQNGWKIGISAKHNHAAVKHSRLSQTIDFGNEWFGIPCSQTYFNTIRPIFEELEQLRNQGELWRNIPDKANRFYVPVLTAFMDELRRLHNANPGEIPRRLLSYLLGRNDFYKVIAYDDMQITEIQGFSLYGTLNRPAGNNQPRIRLHRLRLPNDFYRIDFKPRSNTTIIIACDEGWSISARIHNAKTEVEPSLKFDIQLLAVPPSLYRHHEAW